MRIKFPHQEIVVIKEKRVAKKCVQLIFYVLRLKIYNKTSVVRRRKIINHFKWRKQKIVGDMMISIHKTEMQKQRESTGTAVFNYSNSRKII